MFQFYDNTSINEFNVIAVRARKIIQNDFGLRSNAVNVVGYWQSSRRNLVDALVASDGKKICRKTNKFAGLRA